MPRSHARRPTQLRLIKTRRRFTRSAPGSVLYQSGRTTVLCTAAVEDAVPQWRAGRGIGWLTAEYNMLPGSTSPRKPRDRLKVDGRTTEIQRLIGRSFRAILDLAALGERTITHDCDVLEADGGTRTLSVTGGYIALVDALASIRAPEFELRRAVTGSVAAVSVGIVAGEVLLDLDYVEDSGAEVDLNVVLTGAGQFVELQGTAERGTFDDVQLAGMLAVARKGLSQLQRLQREQLEGKWPLDTK
jgi:ribonuclease PH